MVSPFRDPFKNKNSSENFFTVSCGNSLRDFRRSFFFVNFSRDLCSYSFRDFFKKSDFSRNSCRHSFRESYIPTYIPCLNSTGIPLRTPVGTLDISPNISLKNSQDIYLEVPPEAPPRFLHELFIDLSAYEILSRDVKT